MEQKDGENVAAASEGLDDLLDSCLNDFNKPLPKTAPSSKSEAEEVKTSSTPAKPSEDAWSEEFKQFSDVMETFLEEGSELGELKNLMGNLAQGGPLNVDDNFVESFAETIRGLTEGAQNIPEPTPEDLANLFTGLDIDGSGLSDPEQVSELMPLMHNVMQKLMSKELLYPSLKEIVDKYPQWLNEKHATLKEEDYNLYKKQYDLMKTVCDEFEKKVDDSEDAKKKQFGKVLQLMQEIQSCGNPPKELVSDIGQGVPLDEHGNIQLPGMTEQCAIM
ncbi:hypothetical protein X975_02228, partial [Stegodyphus mimosarum]